MLYLCLTFDYELFFNDSYASEKEILIENTNIIKKALDELDKKATFFIDVPSIFKYKTLKMMEYPNLVEKQIYELINKKHDIQLHFHPIWYKSIYNGSAWKFDNKFYKIQDFKSDEFDIKLELKNSKIYLENICKKSLKDYKCIAYRAGGFCIQPEEGILDYLYDIGIRIDSSVYKDGFMESEVIRYNFLNTPNKLGWFINSRGKVIEEDNKCKYKIFEIPVGMYKKLPNKWILTHGMPRLNYPEIKGKRTPIKPLNIEKNILLKIYNRLRMSVEQPVQFTLDTLHYKALFEIVKSYIKEYDCVKNDCYVCAIGHPKFASLEYANNLYKFIKEIESSELPIKFSTFTDVYNKVKWD